LAVSANGLAVLDKGKTFFKNSLTFLNVVITFSVTQATFSGSGPAEVGLVGG